MIYMDGATYSDNPAAEDGPLIANVSQWHAYFHYGLAAYRIWMRRYGGIWQQRYEWRLESGGYRLESWISATQPSAEWLETTTMHRCAIESTPA